MAYTDNKEKLTKLSALKALADKLNADFATKAEVEAVDSRIDDLVATGGEPNTINSIEVDGTPVAIDEKVAKITLPVYTVEKQVSAEAGYLSTYVFKKDGAQVGEKINIPKDFLVNSADIKEVDTEDQPYAGAAVGDLYIDFVINSKNADDTASHVYLPVNELVDAYTGGNGIDVTASNIISVKVDGANANGLAVTDAGIKLDVATTSTAGAMAATDKEKLDGISVGATKVAASDANGSIKIDDADTTVYTHPAYTPADSGMYKVTVDATGHVFATAPVEKNDITALGIPAQDTTYSDVVAGGASGLMTGTDKTKLDGVAEGATKVEASETAGSIKINGLDTPVVQIATEEEVTEMLNEVFGTQA